MNVTWGGQDWVCDLLWNKDVHLGKPLLSCHTAQWQEPAWHLVIRGLAEPILSVKYRKWVCEKKPYHRFRTKQTWRAFVTFTMLFGSWVTFLIIYSAENILIFYFSSLSGPFYKLSGLKHHYAFLTRSQIPSRLPFKSSSSESRFWKSPQLRVWCVLEKDTEHKHIVHGFVLKSHQPGKLADC